MSLEPLERGRTRGYLGHEYLEGIPHIQIITSTPRGLNLHFMYLKEFVEKLNKCPFREFTFCWKHFFPVWNLFTPMYFHNKCSRHIVRCIDDISLWQLCFSRTWYSLHSVSSLCFWSCGLICWLIWLFHSFIGNLLFQVLSSYSKLHCDPENPLCLFYPMSEFVLFVASVCCESSRPWRNLP